jgi:TadE-like protein
MLGLALKYRNWIKSLGLDQRGLAAVEFALIAPVLFTLLLGAFDVGYALYARAVLFGAVQQAARDSGLRANAANSAAVDQAVMDNIAKMLSVGKCTSEAEMATVNVEAINKICFVRRSYANFSDVNEMEDFTDSDGDNVCDLGEPFEDSNASGSWNEKGESGQGGARATVLYTVTFKFKRIFPVYKLIGGSPHITLSAATVLRNQPYDELAEAVIVPGNCTTEDL